MIYLICINLLGDLVEFLKTINKKMKGTIKTIPDGKSFGFITVEGASKDVFFHANEVKDGGFADLRAGDVVTFEIVETDRNGEKRQSATGVSKE